MTKKQQTLAFTKTEYALRMHAIESIQPPQGLTAGQTRCVRRLLKAVFRCSRSSYDGTLVFTTSNRDGLALQNLLDTSERTAQRWIAWARSAGLVETSIDCDQIGRKRTTMTISWREILRDHPATVSPPSRHSVATIPPRCHHHPATVSPPSRHDVTTIPPRCHHHPATVAGTLINNIDTYQHQQQQQKDDVAVVVENLKKKSLMMTSQERERARSLSVRVREHLDGVAGIDDLAFVATMRLLAGDSEIWDALRAIRNRCDGWGRPLRNPRRYLKSCLGIR
jgi:hypothetical protein